jgi:hypothetical protein
MIRGIEPEVLDRAHARARAAGRELGPVLRDLLRSYADGIALASDLGRRGGEMRSAKQSAEQRRALARTAVTARWAKRRSLGVLI